MSLKVICKMQVSIIIIYFLFLQDSRNRFRRDALSEAAPHG